ncbi:MAG: PatB family C-S lyase [Spirochaetales bacterium]
MPHDFDTVLDRSGTNSLKWDNTSPGIPQVVPLWVADMDFPVAPPIAKALSERVAHPVFGYTNLPAAYFAAVQAWHAGRYQRSISESEWLLAPSVLQAMSTAMRLFTAPGDVVLNLPPVYYPFFKMVALNGRVGLEVPLAHEGLRWGFDFAGLEGALAQAAKDSKPVKALLLSNPHNPTGRAWTRSELERLATLATRYDFFILSDEIHADLVAPGQPQVSVADLPELAGRSLVFAGPNKTFSLAGLPLSHVIARDPALRSRMKRAFETDFFEQPNVLSLTAALAAYQEAGPWLDELKTVIQNNFRLLQEFLATWNLKAVPLEATYLAWVDFSPVIAALGFGDDRDLAKFLEDTGRVKLSAGSIFGTGGSHHLRFNLATPTTILGEGLRRLDAALRAQQGS